MTDDKTARTARPIHEIIARRWSPRAIDPEKTVTRAELTALLEAARWAPSCFGDEPWRFLVFDRSADADGWQRAFDCLAEGNQVWVTNAPVLIAAVAGSTFRRNDKPNRWGQYDTGAASENLCLQATGMGLVAHQMGGFDRARLADICDIPETFTPMAMIAIGHPGDPATLPDGLRKAELDERRRQPLEEIAFAASWATPYRE